MSDGNNRKTVIRPKNQTIGVNGKTGAEIRTKGAKHVVKSVTNSNKPVHPPVTGAKIRSGQNLQTKVSGGLSLEKFKKQQEQKKK